MRKDLLIEGQIYHVFTKSIAEFKVFNNADEFARMKDVIQYYREKSDIKFSRFCENKRDKQFKKYLKKENLVEIIAYCIMPTHIHLILKQLNKNGISIFMSNILNSYTRYFNTKHNRKGPLWEGRFKNILIDTDEYLLHLTRYIHLNPVSAGLVEKPEKWLASSYNEYLFKSQNDICKYDEILNIQSDLYKEFVEDRISYHRELSKIKKYITE